MEVAPRTSCYWWFLFVFGIAIVRIRGDEIRNGTLQTSPNNATNYLTRPMEFDHKDTVAKRNKTYNNIVVTNKGKNNGRGGGWGWGGGSGSGGGGGGGIGGGGGWGWGGGGGGWWGWGCRRQTKYNNSGRSGKKRYHRKDLGHEYKMGEYAQCIGRGRCRWMRLDCPLHCGGPCFYDCKHMCKAHCLR